MVVTSVWPSEQSHAMWNKAPLRLEVFFWKRPAPWTLFKLICSLSGQQYKQVCGNRESFEQCAGKWNLLAYVFGPEARINQDKCRLLMGSSELSDSNHHDLGLKLQTTHVLNRLNMAKLAEESNKPLILFCLHHPRALNIFVDFHMHIDWCVH